jgi:alcohol dehydrogenase class IV
MFRIKAIACRAVQLGFFAASFLLPYREPEILPDYAALANVLKEKKCKKVLIVTSAGSEKRGMLAPLKEALGNKKLEGIVYSKTKPNPTVENVEEALVLSLQNKCEAIVALGGGSAIDCAKAIGARMACPEKKLNSLAGVMRIRKKIPTLIAIPTTAGSGSETTPAAVITDETAKHKYAIMSFPLIPHYAVLDPSLSASMPPSLTAATGMDALTHAVEAYLGRSTTKRTRSLSCEAVALIFQNLKTAFFDGNNLTAREKMLLASYKAGAAFSVSYVGYVHALAHSLGGKYDTPHGLANAVLLPHLLEGYGKSVHKKLHRLAVAAGLSSENDSCEAASRQFIEAIWHLNQTFHLPSGLPELCKEDIPLLAKTAEKEANPLYPVPKIFTAKELEAFYYQIAE